MLVSVKTNYTAQQLYELALKVNCKIHGDFICKPRNFIASLHGCVKCTENLNGHSLSNFIKICKNKNKEEVLLSLFCGPNFSLTIYYYRSIIIFDFVVVFCCCCGC